MAQAGLNMYKAISDGWAQGATLPQKLAAASVAAAEMLKIITAAQQIKMQGFMDGGYTGNIPTNARAGYVHFLNHLCDGERYANNNFIRASFLNHLCDGERCSP